MRRYSISSPLNKQRRNSKMEALILLILSVSIGYLINRIDKFEGKLDALENKVISIVSRFPRRKDDSQE